MSQVAGSVVVAVRAVDEASSVFDKIQASMGVLGSSLGQLGGGFTSVGNVISGFAGAGVVGAAAAGLGEVIKGLQFSVQQAAESEQAWKNLQAAIGATGPAWDTIRSSVDQFASSLQKTTTFSDEQVLGAIQRLTTFGMDYKQAMDAVKTSVDLAAAKHIDLQSATDLVGKAFIGNTGTLQRYGINVDAIKESLGKTATGADVFTAVMAKLNEQFGGQAAEQAQTYAGAQERLKNAVSDLGEKIGGALLPALASLTEGMIPAVDAIGQGFSGLQKWFSELASTVWESLGPALEELMDAFGEIWNALAPIGEAFGEIFAAFSEGEGSGNILKDILGLIALSIKAIASGIKTAAPYIKTLAEAFKDAAEFITPFLVTIRDVVGGFLKWLTDAFQKFYDFLIGHSLWEDLWNGIANISRSIGGTLMSILKGLFEVWKGVFNIGMEAIKTILTTGFSLAFAAIQTIVTGAIDVLKGIVQTFVDLLGTGQKTWSDLVSAVATNVADMRGKIQAFFGWLTPYWAKGVSDIVSDMQIKLDAITSKVTNATATMQSTWKAAIDNMVSTTETGLQKILNNMSWQVDAIISRLRAARQEISGGSIWPDMLAEMVSQTGDAMRAIQGEFNRGFESPSGIIPRIESAAPAVGETGLGVTGGFTRTQEITVPVTISLDGQVIYRSVEKRLVDQLLLDANRSRRA